MASSFIDKIYEGGSWVPSYARFTNNTGSLLTGAYETPRSSLLADVYTLVLSAVAGSVATVTITTGSPNNPWNGRVVAGVTINTSVFDATTFPGLYLTYNNTPVNGWTSTIIVGEQKGTFQSAGASTGVPSAGVRHQVFNDNGADAFQCKARVMTQIYYLLTAGTIFHYVEGFAEDAVEKVDPLTGQLKPYVVSISGVTGVGLSKVANLSVDGVVLGANTIRDLATMGLVSGTGLKATAPTSPNYYKIVDGPLKGLVFSVHESATNGSSARLMVALNRHLEIAPDIAGVAGTYGVADVNLTTVGQVVGTILDSDVAYYWSRVKVHDGANGRANPNMCNVAIVANTYDPLPAGWS